jgi:hypothetical protein
MWRWGGICCEWLTSDPEWARYESDRSTHVGAGIFPELAERRVYAAMISNSGMNSYEA